MYSSITLLLLRKVNNYKEGNSLIHLGKTMPKNKKNTPDSKGKETSNKNVTVEKGAIYCNSKNEVIMKIHAKPGAKESIITDISDDCVGVQIAAPPIDGEANKELIRYLAEILQLKKSYLSLEKGSRSKEKAVVIFGMSLEDVILKTKVASKQ